MVLLSSANSLVNISTLFCNSDRSFYGINNKLHCADEKYLSSKPELCVRKYQIIILSKSRACEYDKKVFPQKVYKSPLVMHLISKISIL